MRALPIALVLSLSPGCFMVDGVEVAWSAPALHVDIDAERAALEAALCADAAAAACVFLGALDAHDGSRESAPAFPALMPRTLSVARLGDVGPEGVDVAEWIDAQRREVRDVLPTLALTLDAGLGERLEGARIVDAALRFDEDTLAVDLPALDITVGDERIGVIAAHIGGGGEQAQLAFVDGGVAALSTALMDGGDVALTPVGAAASFLQDAGAELRRPGGSADLVLDLRVAISAGRVLDELR